MKLRKFFIFITSIIMSFSYTNAQTCAGNASDSSGACLCNQGFYGTNPTSTSAICTACPNGSTTDTPSSSAGGNSASNTDVSTCIYCSQGFYMTAYAVTSSGSKSGQGATCVACPQYSSTDGISSTIQDITYCTCYDLNANYLTVSNPTCKCLDSYSGTVATSSGSPSSCTLCPEGQYSNNGSACQDCATGSMISSASDSCICNDISTGTTPWSSITNVCQCQANYYGDPSTASPGVTGSCRSCPSGTGAEAGLAKTASDCTIGGAATTDSPLLLIYWSVIFLVVLVLV